MLTLVRLLSANALIIMNNSSSLTKKFGVRRKGTMNCIEIYLDCFFEKLRGDYLKTIIIKCEPEYYININGKPNKCSDFEKSAYHIDAQPR